MARYARWHAAQTPGRTSRSAGVSLRHRSTASGQRGWNAQPGGRSPSGGGSPGMPWNAPFRASDGRVAISIRVYGWLRLGEDLADRRDLHQPAGVHDAEAVDELGHQPHVVADQDDRGAQLRLGPGQGVHHLALDDHVERARGLVGHDHLRGEAHGDRDAGPLLHAAAQLVREHVADLGVEADPRQEVPQPVEELPLR